MLTRDVGVDSRRSQKPFPMSVANAVPPVTLPNRRLGWWCRRLRSRGSCRLRKAAGRPRPNDEEPSARRTAGRPTTEPRVPADESSREPSAIPWPSFRPPQSPPAPRGGGRTGATAVICAPFCAGAGPPAPVIAAAAPRVGSRLLGEHVVEARLVQLSAAPGACPSVPDDVGDRASPSVTHRGRPRRAGSPNRPSVAGSHCGSRVPDQQCSADLGLQAVGVPSLTIFPWSMMATRRRAGRPPPDTERQQTVVLSLLRRRTSSQSGCGSWGVSPVVGCRTTRSAGGSD